MKQFIYRYAWFFPLLIACGGNEEVVPEVVNTAPSSFIITVSQVENTRATLSWNAAVDAEDDPVRYSIQQGSTHIPDVGSLSYTFENLAPNTQYKGSVTAADGQGGETAISYNYTTTDVGQGNAGDFSIPADLEEYYKHVDFSKTSEELYQELASLTSNKHTNILSYTDRHDYLYDADEDENNTDNVILIYSGESRYWEEYQGNGSYANQTFNTEHIYPQSLITEIAKTDLHHLRVCDAGINSSRSNHPFTDGSGGYQKMGNSWYPGDTWKGDVARMVMYVHLRYDEPWADISTEGRALFIRWNAEDPVSAIEIQRNDIFEGAQGNRNPFIDNPYLVTILWGGETAENLWDN